MKASQAVFPVVAMCGVLRLSSSGYYDWLKRPASGRVRRDVDLQGQIRLIWSDSLETYGRPRIHTARRASGWARSEWRA